MQPRQSLHRLHPVETVRPASLRARPRLVSLLGFGLTLGASSVACATECGELTAVAQHLRAAAKVTSSPLAKEAQSQLQAVEPKRQAACAPTTVTISALPLGYLPVPAGNLSKASIDLPQASPLVLTTQAGDEGGLVFDEPATLTLPGPVHLESQLQADTRPGDLQVAVALGARLTVDEFQPGRGRWKIAVPKAPQAVTLSALESCAEGKDRPLGLSKGACEGILVSLPRTRPPAVAARGRGLVLGEWQYGWGATIDLGEPEQALSEESASELRQSAPPTRVPLRLELSGPIPGVAEDRVLRVILEEAHTRTAATFKLGHSCGEEDAACQDRRTGMQLEWDRAFGVPLLRQVPALPGRPSVLLGKITDRLARPIEGQRVAVTLPNRRVVTTVTDREGEYRLVGLPAGELLVSVVGRERAPRQKGDEPKRIVAGLGETKASVIFISKAVE
jgi:hypothetical protein